VKIGCADLLAVLVLGTLVAITGLVGMVALAAQWPLAALALGCGTVTWALFRVTRLLIVR